MGCSNGLRRILAGDNLPFERQILLFFLPKQGMLRACYRKFLLMPTGQAFAINPDSDSKGPISAKDLGRYLFLAFAVLLGFQAFSRLELSRLSSMNSGQLGAEIFDLGLSLLLYLLLSMLACFLSWLFLVKRGASVDPRAKTVTEWWSLCGLGKKTTHLLSKDSWLEVQELYPPDWTGDPEVQPETLTVRLHFDSKSSLLVHDKASCQYPSRELAQEFAERMGHELDLKILVTTERREEPEDLHDEDPGTGLYGL